MDGRVEDLDEIRLQSLPPRSNFLLFHLQVDLLVDKLLMFNVHNDLVWKFHAYVEEYGIDIAYTKSSGMC